ncbi:hypothetical protein [Rhodopirellula sp. P2]|uniref:hypothetical protein n=1 Tax=Rhodopirellula sp. P2 TaxID=2127060 RepID=UPI0023682F36|nr:hypothetical protein [Rhodopirellula sp. P2]WDQ15334.1 hypothetical protein PSR62_17010 [Rhodopirellula sp. P2]
MPHSPKLSRRRKLRRTILASVWVALNTSTSTSLAADPAEAADGVTVDWMQIDWTANAELDSRPSAEVIAKIDRNLAQLESDSAIIRRMTSDRLFSLAIHGGDEVRRAVLGRLRSLRVSLSLDVRQTADQLDQRIRLAAHQQAIESLARSPWDDLAANVDDERNRELDQWWQHFSERAGDDADSIRQFQQVAKSAGPDWQWQPALPRWTPSNRSACDQWACLLGICVPDCGIRYVPASNTLKRHLLQDGSLCSRGQTPGDRVVGRLIESTLQRNPYGWSLETRLSIGLIHQRTELVQGLCEQIWNTPNARPRDIALSLLAADRVQHPSRMDHLNLHLDDRRVITVLPGQAHFGVGEANWPRSIVVPRVCDVAQYLIWKDQGIDARQEGMTAIQADPTWGTRLESIGR